MKKKLLSTAVIATAALAFAQGHAGATSVPTNQIGDLFLGFEAAGTSDDLEVDVGPITNYLNATSAFNVTFGDIPSTSTPVTNLNSDLGIFGASGAWASNTALFWGLVGLTQNGSHYNIFLTQDATDTDPVPTQSYFGEGNTVSDIESVLGGQGLGGSPNDGFSTVAAAVTASGNDTWSDFGPSTGNSGFDTGLKLEQQNGDPAVGSLLNLYEQTPNGSGSGDATKIGSFALDDSGDLTFTPASVPEPSTWASIIGGALFLGFFRRRNLRTS